MNMDEKLYGLPFIGWMIKRLYGYFRNNIAVTDFMHVALGFGLGLLVAEKGLTLFSGTALGIGILGHIFAFIKGR